MAVVIEVVEFRYIENRRRLKQVRILVDDSRDVDDSRHAQVLAR